MKLINEKIVTITIKEDDYHEFRIKLPHYDKTSPTIYRDVHWHRMPYKITSSGNVACLDILGDFVLTEHCSDEIIRYIQNKDFPEFNVIMNPSPNSNCLAYTLAIKLYQLRWKEISDYNVVVKNGEIPNKYLGVQYHSVKTMKGESFYITDVDAYLIKDSKVLLVDDIYDNTGTIEACKELVDKAGGNVSGIVTIAVNEGCKPMDDLHYLFELPIIKL